jgi:hypothetical protein
MWMYLGPCCPVCSFSTELGNTKINTWVQGVLAHGANLNLGYGLDPLREGVDIPWVSLLRLTFSYLCQFLFLSVCVFLCRISGMLASSRRRSLYLRMW